MCIITDEKDIVISISLIPGLGYIPVGYHVYFPAKLKNGIPKRGTIYTEEKEGEHKPS